MMASALEGVWRLKAAWLSGRELDITEMRIAQLELDADLYRLVDRAGEVVDHGRYRLDRSISPWGLDLVGEVGLNAGRTLEALVSLEIDEPGETSLLIGYDVDGGPRPEDFQAEGEELLLTMRYARIVPRQWS